MSYFIELHVSSSNVLKPVLVNIEEVAYVVPHHKNGCCIYFNGVMHTSSNNSLNGTQLCIHVVESYSSIKQKMKFV
jgi:hypothetical protein